MKAETSQVLTSSLIVNDKLNVKREKVNEMLKTKYTESNLKYIENSNIITKVHTNLKGTITLARNYIESLN